MVQIIAKEKKLLTLVQTMSVQTNMDLVDGLNIREYPQPSNPTLPRKEKPFWGGIGNVFKKNLYRFNFKAGAPEQFLTTEPPKKKVPSIPQTAEPKAPVNNKIEPEVTEVPGVPKVPAVPGLNDRTKDQEEQKKRQKMRLREEQKKKRTRKEQKQNPESWMKDRSMSKIANLSIVRPTPFKKENFREQFKGWSKITETKTEQNIKDSPIYKVLENEEDKKIIMDLYVKQREEREEVIEKEKADQKGKDKRVIKRRMRKILQAINDKLVEDLWQKINKKIYSKLLEGELLSESKVLSEFENDLISKQKEQLMKTKKKITQEDLVEKIWQKTNKKNYRDLLQQTRDFSPKKIQKLPQFLNLSLHEQELVLRQHKETRNQIAREQKLEAESRRNQIAEEKKIQFNSLDMSETEKKERMDALISELDNEEVDKQVKRMKRVIQHTENKLVEDMWKQVEQRKRHANWEFQKNSIHWKDEKQTKDQIEKTKERRQKDRDYQETEGKARHGKFSSQPRTRSKSPKSRKSTSSQEESSNQVVQERGEANEEEKLCLSKPSPREIQTKTDSDNENNEQGDSDNENENDSDNENSNDSWESSADQIRFLKQENKKLKKMIKVSVDDL